MDMPGFTDKTKPFLALQDELRSGVPSDSRRGVARRDEVVADLSAYFENLDRLERVFDVCALRYEHAFLQRNKGFPWVDTTLRLMLKEFRGARDCNASLCFETWGSMMDSVDRGLRNVSVVGSLQLDIDKHGPQLTAKSVLRDVGDVLEGSVQPLARLRLAMQEVAGIRIDRPPSIANMTFGDVICELASRELEAMSTVGIPVSQWRNIANHNSYTVKDDEVTCTYGSPGLAGCGKTLRSTQDSKRLDDKRLHFALSAPIAPNEL